MFSAAVTTSLRRRLSFPRSRQRSGFGKRRKTMKNRITLMVFTLAFGLLTYSRDASADSFTFTLLSSNTGSAPPGGTLGFGYSLTNNSASSLAITGLDVIVSSLNLDSTVLNPNILFDFPIVDPGATLSAAYAPGLAGLFELMWDPLAPIGYSTAGTVTMTGYLCSDAFEQTTCSDPIEQSAAFTATVTSPAGPAPVPEPSTLLLVATGVAGLALKHRWS